MKFTRNAINVINSSMGVARLRWYFNKVCIPKANKCPIRISGCVQKPKLFNVKLF